MTLQQDSTHPTGVSDDTPKGNSDVARARGRKSEAAMQLRRDGYTWEEIARYLGYPTARMALVATENALANHLRTKESQDFMRQMAADRLTKLLRSVWRKATDPEHPEQLAALEAVRRIVVDDARIQGYEAPKQNVLTTPSTRKLEEYVSTILKMQGTTVQEADLFGDVVDAEVVEDEMPSLSEDS